MATETCTMTYSQILTAAEYHCIPTFEEQQGWHMPEHILKIFAALFVELGIARDWALGIQHRHFDLTLGTAPIHHEIRHMEDRCEITMISELTQSSLRSLRPHSFCLRKGEFRPFEFDFDTERQHLHSKAQQDLRALILQYELAERLAIVPYPKASEELFEFQLPDRAGMMTIPKSQVDATDIRDSEPIITTWAFLEVNGGIEVRAVKNCVIQKSGLHKEVG